MNNVLWRVVAGRIRRDRGPDAARGPPVGHPWTKLLKFLTQHFTTTTSAPFYLLVVYKTKVKVVV